MRACVVICYGILITLVVQMFAVVNQRRYRSAFWFSFVTLFLSITLCITAFSWYKCHIENVKENTALISNRLKERADKEVWIKFHYLVALPIIAALQIALFTKRPSMLFEKKNTV